MHNSRDCPVTLDSIPDPYFHFLCSPWTGGAYSRINAKTSRRVSTRRVAVCQQDESPCVNKRRLRADFFPPRETAEFLIHQKKVVMARRGVLPRFNRGSPGHPDYARKCAQV